MNQRYHQRLAQWWRWWDFVAKVATAFLAVAGAMISVAALSEGHDPSIDAWGVFVAASAALAAVILNVAPFGGWEKEHLDLFRQWTDIREDSESLLFECPREPEPHQICNVQKLDAKLHRICGLEPSPNRKLLDECYRAEKRSREKNPPPEPPTWWDKLWARYFGKQQVPPTAPVA